MERPTPPPGYVYLKSVSHTDLRYELQKSKNALPGIPDSNGKTPIFVQEREVSSR
jgi:hypothetical protein